MRQTRPKNLNLFTIHFPIPAIVSILHRISGVILFLLIPFFLFMLSCSLTPSGFEQCHEWLSSPVFKVLVWLYTVPLCFHLVAGIRHLLSDIHIGDSRQGGRITSYLTFFFSALLIILTGIWIW
ncbi:MAG TPA: succinate dehydrogenase, cytochrome b556 subunit [Gammaproteobacteria bacterium]|nr:succinate dehydrogenase, cytochrome b556 subunit [Gammaproteobacteria bacterium]